MSNATPRPVIRRARSATSTLQSTPQIPSPLSQTQTPVASPAVVQASTTGSKARIARVNSFSAESIEDREPKVDIMQYGILGWKEYALRKFADNPAFVTSAVGKELIIESAMWELQQKLKMIEVWADDVENASFDLERQLRAEKKARLKAEAKLRELQMAITKSPAATITHSILEQSKESLVRSPSRGASPIHQRALSPPPDSRARGRSPSPYNRHASPTSSMPDSQQPHHQQQHHQQHQQNQHSNTLQQRYASPSPGRRASRSGKSHSPEALAVPVAKKTGMRNFLSSFLGKTKKAPASAGGGAQSISTVEKM